MLYRYFFTLMVTTLLASASHAAEATGPDFNVSTLTGDWGGTRTKLYDNGIDLGFTHKSDFLSNLSGGFKTGSAWMGHTEARAHMDLEKLLNWNNTTAFIHFHSDLGSKFNRDYVGAFDGVDNIETSANTAQFYNVWVQKNSADDRLSILAGLYPIDSEFYVTDSSALFTEPPYGIANEVAQPIMVASSNIAPQAPAIFPTGALAVRVKYVSPKKNFYSQYAILDGVPGDPNNARGTHIQLNKGDGTFSIAEFGYTPQDEAPNLTAAQASGTSEPVANQSEEGESFNKTALGFWRYSAQFNDPVSVDTRRSSQGIYFLAERTLMSEKEHPSQGLAGFIRLGMASPEVHQSDWTSSLGLRYHGLIAGRENDLAGIATTYIHTSSKYRQLNTTAYSDQTNVEATYRAQLKPWFSLQPSLQYIRHPNMDPSLKNAWTFSTRAEIAF